MSNKQPNLPPRGVGKRRTNTAQSWQKEGNSKNQGGNNKIQTKKQ